MHQAADFLGGLADISLEMWIIFIQYRFVIKILACLIWSTCSIVVLGASAYGKTIIRVGNNVLWRAYRVPYQTVSVTRRMESGHLQPFIGIFMIFLSSMVSKDNSQHPAMSFSFSQLFLLILLYVLTGYATGQIIVALTRSHIIVPRRHEDGIIFAAGIVGSVVFAPAALINAPVIERLSFDLMSCLWGAITLTIRFRIYLLNVWNVATYKSHRDYHHRCSPWKFVLSYLFVLLLTVVLPLVLFYSTRKHGQPTYQDPEVEVIIVTA